MNSCDYELSAVDSAGISRTLRANVYVLIDAKKLVAEALSRARGQMGLSSCVAARRRRAIRLLSCAGENPARHGSSGPVDPEPARRAVVLSLSLPLFLSLSLSLSLALAKCRTSGERFDSRRKTREEI